MIHNIFIIVLSVVMNCAAQLLMRKGMLEIGELNISQVFGHLGAMLCNIWLWMAVLCFAVSILSWLVVLSKFEVSFAYPISSIGYILAAVAGYVFLGEHLSWERIVGILVICIGVVLITKS